MSDGRNVIPLQGLLSLDATAYHADAIGDQRPSLSKSIIAELINKSPAHAYQQHPRLNPNFVREDDDRFNVGTVVHSLFLEGVDAVAVLPFNDYKTNAAKEARADAKASGRIPMLAAQYDECLQMVDAIRRQCDAAGLEPALFADGKPEQTIVWEEGDVLCRARIDWLRDDLVATDDLKTTKASANPLLWKRTAFGIGAEIQAAFYGRGLRAVTGQDPAFRFVVVECQPPYGLSVVEMDELSIAVGNAKVDRALEMWRDCLSTGLWPGYATDVFQMSPPGWELRWLDNSDQFQEDAWAQM